MTEEKNPIIVELTIEEYKELISDSERLNILRGYMDSPGYKDEKVIKIIIGMEGDWHGS